MHIAIDTTAMPANRAGAGVYTYHLTRALVDALPGGARLTVFDRWGAFTDLGTRAGVRVERVRLPGRGRRIAWEQSGLPAALRRSGAWLFHSPHHSAPVLTLGWRTVVTVHDVTFRLLPWRYPLARRLYMTAVTALSVRRADAVIVPSASVAHDLARLFAAPARHVAVIPEAPSALMRPIEDARSLEAVRQRLGLPPRFILSVGTLEPGKNRGSLLRAVAELRRRGAPHPLVIVGQRGWGERGAQPLAERLGVADRVQYTGYIPDEDLAAVYNLADAFLFPSWREGFGLPPLEAMACGTPVVASNRPAMPEVLGDAALYAPPGRADMLADAVERVLSDEGLRERLRGRGLLRAADFTWERAAHRTLAVYQYALGLV